MRLVLRLLILFVLCLKGLWAFGQCTIISADKGCIGEPVAFDYNSSLTVVSVHWDFGDGNSANQAKPSHRYTKGGQTTVKLTLTISGGGPCTVEKKIFIYDNPVPKITISPTSKYCLDSNNIVLFDNSSPGNGSSRIEARLVLWGDGDRTLSNYPNINPNTAHTYNRDGKYTLDIELTNENTCKALTTLSIEILPYYQPSFTVSSKDLECDSMVICLRNDSIKNSASLKNLTWVWGDGNKLTGFQTAICHTYFVSSIYKISLIAEHVSGCTTAVSISENLQLPRTILNPDFGVKRKCRNQEFTFTQPNVPQVTFIWTIKDTKNQVVNSGYNNSKFTFSIDDPGKYYVELLALNGNCISKLIDSIEVVGVKASIRLLNSHQCDNRDTVYFNAYYTTYGTDSLKQTWNFGDMYGLNCITAIGDAYSGCKFSQQQFAKHKYDSMGCYGISLTVKDIKNGCSDLQREIIRLNTPDTSKITLQMGKPCAGLGTNNAFSFSAPDCVDSVHINLDSACGKENFVSFPYSPFNYDKVCDTSRWVTVGFRIFSGSDTVFTSNDTAVYRLEPSRKCKYEIWKSRWFRMLPSPDARFTISHDPCPPTDLRMDMVIKKQTNVRRAIIYWKPGQPDTFSVDGLNDSIGPFFRHFPASVKQGIAVILETDSGCLSAESDNVILGHFSHFDISAASCPGIPITLADSIRYLDGDVIDQSNPNKTAWWRIKAQRDAGIETILWDFDDGKLVSGSANEPVPVVVFDKAGKRTITMITKDRRGCYDTLKRSFDLSGVIAGIQNISKKLLCSDIIQLFDSSKITGTPGLDQIVEYLWDFGDGKTMSYLENPYHFYSSYGTFDIKHSVKSALGCRDTVQTQITIDGPIPFFTIRDSIGCAPLTSIFDNHSKKCTEYIWSFGDTANSVRSTDKDTSMRFTYTVPGIYYIYLFGADSIVNPDNQNQRYYCSAVFPDTSSPLAAVRRVIVLPDPAVDIDMPDFWCKGDFLNLKSKSDTIYEVFNWNIDGQNITIYQSDTTVRFATDKDKIQIKLNPTFSRWGSYDAVCFDSAYKEINVSAILADFSYRLDSMCNELSLTDNSQNGVAYAWAYKKGTNAIGSSKEKNPAINLNSYDGSISVCLTVTDSNGCKNERCDSVQLNDIGLRYEIPNVFTPNNDGINDVYDIAIKNQNHYQLTIFNRWGEIVYESSEDGTTANDLNWTGMYRNGTVKLPEGAYFYIFETDHRCNPNAERIKIQGTVTLIRGE